MATDPYRLQKKTDFWNDESDRADDLSLPQQPQFQRCAVVRCIEQGRWAGTFICCMRKAGHQGDHLTTLGDVGTFDYWRETWL